MARWLQALLGGLAARPLVLAAAVGAVVAYPVASAPTGLWGAAGGVASLLVPIADLRRVRRTWLAPLASTIGVLGLAALAIGQRPDEPAFGLVMLMATTWSLLHAWRTVRAPVRSTTPTGSTSELPSPAGVLLLATAVLTFPQQLPVPRVLLFVVLAVLGLPVVRAADARRADVTWLDLVLDSPARLLVLSFALLGGVGALLLELPFASTGPGSIALIDAVFTAVSASCVTGLAVLDTPTAFTLFGQVVILALIQFGGLGIMTFAAAAAVYLGRRLGVREEALAANLIGGPSARDDLGGALRTVFRVTLWAELIGAVLLAPLFIAHGDGVPMAVWRAVFTSISAFCNAGFALQTDSLISYQGSPGILLTVSALIALGGLGPPVVVAAPLLLRGRGSLHAKLAIAATAVLLVVPALFFLVIEWEGTLAGMGVVDKLANAWFQSVTLRTAGFNSIDFAAIHPATWTVAILCMFVGGSPASTAGGIKTTTVATLVLAVVAAGKGRSEASAFGRRIPHRTIYEAAAITTVGVLSAVAALVAIQVTQPIALDHAVFEVASALGTVGLTMGATAKLDGIGKVLIVLCMFAGRVGPLTLFIFFVGQSKLGRRYPLETVQVG